MSDPSQKYGRLEQIIGLVVLSLLLIGSFLVVWPFLTSLVWAAVLGFCLWPTHMRLTGWLKGRHALSAMIMSSLIAMVLLVPFVIIGFNLGDDTKELRVAVRNWIDAKDHTPPAWVSKIPVVGHQAAVYWTEFSEEQARVLRELRAGPVTATTAPTTMPATTSASESHQSRVTQFLRSSLASVQSLVISFGLAVGQGVILVALSVFLTFFIFRDGASVAERLNAGLTRIAGERGAHLLTVAGNTVRGVVYGILGTAIVQGVMAGIGFIIAGVPGAALLGLLTFFLSPLPIGPPLVWIPASIWLFGQGFSGWGIFMLIWGLGVSSVDNVVKPWIISHEVDMPFILIFLGVVGGALAFGLIGVFLGPTLLAVVFRIVEEWLDTRVARRHRRGNPR